MIKKGGKEKKKKKKSSTVVRGIERVNDTWTSIESPRGRRKIFSQRRYTIGYIHMYASFRTSKQGKKKTYTPSIESFEIGKITFEKFTKRYRVQFDVY